MKMSKTSGTISVFLLTSIICASSAMARPSGIERTRTLECTSTDGKNLTALAEWTFNHNFIGIEVGDKVAASRAGCVPEGVIMDSATGQILLHDFPMYIFELENNRKKLIQDEEALEAVKSRNAESLFDSEGLLNERLKACYYVGDKENKAKVMMLDCGDSVSPFCGKMQHQEVKTINDFYFSVDNQQIRHAQCTVENNIEEQTNFFKRNSLDYRMRQIIKKAKQQGTFDGNPY